MNRKSVTHGTPAQLEAALENKIEELSGSSVSSCKGVNAATNIKASVEWSHFNQYEPFMDQYLPPQGEGDTKATQLVTAVTKLIYKWYNDGDVYDNNYGMDGWCNDLSSYANWIYNNYRQSQSILNKIKDVFTDGAYEDILMKLAAFCFDNDFLAEENKKPADGSIYTESGPFSFSEYTDDEDDEYYDDDDEYDDIYNATEIEPDDEVTASDEWEMLQTKSVEDSDGFMTDYTLYKHKSEDRYICILGDNEIYGPEDGADWECDTEEEALSWFNSYSGLGDDTDTDIDTLIDNAGGVDYIREVVSEVIEAYPGIDDDVDELAQILSDRYDELTEYEWISVLQYLADDLGIYCATAVTAANDGLPYLDIDEDKLAEARQDLYNKLDELEESFPEIEWDNVESPEDIDMAMILYVNYGLQDGEDYQIGNGETDIIIDNKNDGRWHQVATDLNYSEGSNYDSDDEDNIDDYIYKLIQEVRANLHATLKVPVESIIYEDRADFSIDPNGDVFYSLYYSDIVPNLDDLPSDILTVTEEALNALN